jgi:hypothetical protein
MTDLIRWTDASDGGFFGFAARYHPAAFKVIPPDTKAGEDFWMLSNYMCPPGSSRFGGSAEEMKSAAETWLREFASSLGALFAADLRKHLTEQAAIEQELGDDYGDSASPLAESQSHRHWGRAEALRDLLKYLDHEAEAQR